MEKREGKTRCKNIFDKTYFLMEPASDSLKMIGSRDRAEAGKSYHSQYLCVTPLSSAGAT